jgi:hypothetical protein
MTGYAHCTHSCTGGFKFLPVSSAVAQHHASKQKAEKPKTDAELIASALSAAPAAVSKDATIGDQVCPRTA